MIRFSLFIALCLAAISGVGYVLTDAVQASGRAHRERVHPKPGNILDRVDEDEAPPNPGANLEAKLRSLIDDRNRKVAETKLGVGRSAAQVVQMMRELQMIRRQFDVEMKVYNDMVQYANGRAGRYAVLSGGRTFPVPEMPRFPSAQILSHLTRLKATIEEHRIALNSAENQVQMIQNQFLREFIDIVGERRASEAPPIPHTPVDDAIEEANGIVANYQEMVRKVVHGYM